MLTTTVSTEDALKGIPRRLKVGQFTFRLVTTNETDEPELKDADGTTVFGSHYRIYIADRLTLERAVNVVQHELSHAINWVYGIDDESTEEQFTQQHSNGLVAMWLDNPRLMNWMVKSIRRMKKEASRD